MNIRTANEADAGVLAALHTESWRSAYRGILSDHYLANEIEADRQIIWSDRMTKPRPDQHVLIAETDDGPQGFLCLFGVEAPEWGVYVDNLHVRPDVKGRGTGSALLREGAAWIQQHYPGSGIWLWVYEANKNARHFYERLGAENAERVISETPGGGSAPALRYAWRTLSLVLNSR